MLTIGTLPLIGAQSASAAGGDLFFSEYVEGSSNNKALEIYNGTGAPVNLATAGYNVQMYFNGSASAGLTINLTGTVADKDVFVLANSGAGAAILAQADQTNSSGWFNGDDAIVLRKGTTVLDVIGQIGFDPGTEWGSGLTSTADNTLRRKASVTTGDPDGSNAFAPGLEWDGYATDTFDGLGSHVADPFDYAPEVTDTTPADGATDVRNEGDLSVTFSEPVTVASGGFTVECGGSSYAVSRFGGPTTYTVDPAEDLPLGTQCTFTVHADKVTDRDATPTPMAADHVVTFTTTDTAACDRAYTPAYDIQGHGTSAAVTGLVDTEGVVVGDYEGSGLKGFYLQDAAGDGDPATSDAVFVYNGSADEVDLGDVVHVYGTAEDYQGQTQVSARFDGVSVCGSGASVDPTTVTLPFADTAAQESLEGMLVKLPQTLTVTEHYQLGRFGQVLLSSGGRLLQPTMVARPGPEVDALQAANDRNQILVDDASQSQNPDPVLFARDGRPLSAENTLRGGDTATGTVGVMTYTWGGASASPNAYRVRPVNALGGTIEFKAGNERRPRPDDVPGDLKVASFNVLNYFNTFNEYAQGKLVPKCRGGLEGQVMECRGADDSFEFGRQADKIVAALAGLDADVVGLLEIENDGYGPDSAIQDLVNRLNDRLGAGTYAFVDADAATGQVDVLGDDAIKVGLLYKPAKVMRVGQTAVLNTDTFVDGASGEPRNRPALAQTFQDRDGGRFTLAVNHLKSKGSDCNKDGDPDTGDGQGNCNITRTESAQELAAWLAGDPTAVDDPDTLVMGDLNSYAMEDPVVALKDAGYTDMVHRFEGTNGYSYVFDGQWGYLDHALASQSLADQVKGTTTWHINADEPPVLDYNDDFKSPGQVEGFYAPTPYRSSDHDPVLVGLDLSAGDRVVDSWVTGTGSYVDPAGVASFDLSALYTPGTTTVAGSTTLTVPGLGTVAASASWLSADLDRNRMLYGGPATLDGQSGYTLAAWVTDGGKKGDQVRFQLRDAAGDVVHDSGVAPVASGNVVIHRR